MRKPKQTISQKIKTRARRGLNSNVKKQRKDYVIDTSAVINQALPKLLLKGLKGRIIIPNAVMAELENLANKGFEAGFKGLDEVAKLHKLKHQYKINIFFEGVRPQDFQIRYAKSGEIDAIIRNVAFKHKAVLVTADLVQAKSAQAYGLNVVFIKPRAEKEESKKKFLFFKFNRKRHHKL
ncbi:hypothetical protein HYT26_02735 [Candidatus Pacearchaeota archaeon]|nr:hypothetical protein [Candidatus Pacearchaeota archaeon]